MLRVIADMIKMQIIFGSQFRYGIDIKFIQTAVCSRKDRSCSSSLGLLELFVLHGSKAVRLAFCQLVKHDI